MESSSLLATLGAVAALVLLVFVAAVEAALERASRVRIQALAAKGDRRAQRLVGTPEAPRELGRLLPGAMLGRVTTSAGVIVFATYVAAAETGQPLAVLAAGGGGFLAAAAAQLLATQLVFDRPEAVAVRFHLLALALRYVFGGPAWLIALPARLLHRPLQVVTSPEDDILALVEREEAAGGVEEQERRMIRGIIALEDKTAREIMVPRIDIVAADHRATVRDVAQLMVERGFSRIPIYRENIDDIIGIVYAKDLLRALTNGVREPKLTDLLREPMFIPESKRLDQLLAEMRSTRTHMAIVVDEYGGTAGLVTIEDLLEEIVGEIEDEYDVERSLMEVVSEDEVILDAGVPTDVLKELFGYEVESEEYDTLGGLVIDRLGRLPKVGDEVRIGPLALHVVSMAGRRIRRIRVRRLREGAESEAMAG